MILGNERLGEVSNYYRYYQSQGVDAAFSFSTDLQKNGFIRELGL